MGFINKVVFRPGTEGLAKIVGANEQLVLAALWEKGPLPGRRLYEEVRGSKKLAYTTVLTIVGRMVKKGSVRRKRVDGLYYYEAAMDKSEFERRASAAVVKAIIDVSPTYALSAFVDTISEWDEGKLDEIMKVIEERRKADGK